MRKENTGDANERTTSDESPEDPFELRFLKILKVVFFLCISGLAYLAVPPIRATYLENQRIENWMKKRDRLLSSEAKGKSLAWAEQMTGTKLKFYRDEKGDLDSESAFFELECPMIKDKKSLNLCSEEAVKIVLGDDGKILYSERQASSI